MALTTQTIEQIDEELASIENDCRKAADKALEKNAKSLKGKAEKYRAEHIARLREKLEEEAEV